MARGAFRGEPQPRGALHEPDRRLNEGRLELGDDIMLVLAGGDIRPHVIDALQSLVGEIKQHCVVEKEIY